MQLDPILEGQIIAPADATAVVCCSDASSAVDRVTFGDLEAHAQLLATGLMAVLPKHEKLIHVLGVGLLSYRSPDAIAGLLAIWRVGAAYLPLDPCNSIALNAMMIQHASPAAILVGRECQVPDSCACPALRLKDGSHFTGPISPISTIKLPAACAYVMFSSGSTGRPKAILGSREGLAARCGWMWRAFPFATHELGAYKTPCCFIDHLWEIIGPLGRGLPLCLLPTAALLEPSLLVDMLSLFRVTRLVMVPSALRLLCDECEERRSRARDVALNLRVLTCSGDALPLELAQRAADILPDTVFLNLYGSTEVSADVTCHTFPSKRQLDTSAQCSRRAICPLGYPIDGAQIRLMPPCWDGGAAELAVNLRSVSEQADVAGNEPGEIWVGGPLLALGYLGDPELSASKFVLSASLGDDGSQIRWFRTGDLGRWSSTGELLFAGRCDTQLKVRGARVEPREVEAAYEGFTDAAVRIRGALAVPLLTEPDERCLNDGDRVERHFTDGLLTSTEHLVLLYIVRDAAYDNEESGGTRLDLETSRQLASKLRAWGETRLSAWSIPSYFLAVDALPQLASGKLDRIFALKIAPILVKQVLEANTQLADDDLAGCALHSLRAADESASCACLCAALSRELGLRTVINPRSLFLGYGGTSLLAVRLCAALRASGWALPIHRLFEDGATLAELAEHMCRLDSPQPSKALLADGQSTLRSLVNWSTFPNARLHSASTQPPFRPLLQPRALKGFTLSPLVEADVSEVAAVAAASCAFAEPLTAAWRLRAKQVALLEQNLRFFLMDLVRPQQAGLSFVARDAVSRRVVAFSLNCEVVHYLPGESPGDRLHNQMGHTMGYLVAQTFRGFVAFQNWLSGKSIPELEHNSRLYSELFFLWTRGRQASFRPGQCLHMVLSGSVSETTGGETTRSPPSTSHVMAMAACDAAALEAATARGFAVAYTCCTNEVTKYLAGVEMGFTPRVEIRTVEFDHNGQKPFATLTTLPREHTVCLYERCLLDVEQARQCPPLHLRPMSPARTASPAISGISPLQSTVDGARAVEVEEESKALQLRAAACALIADEFGGRLDVRRELSCLSAGSSHLFVLCDPRPPTDDMPVIIAALALQPHSPPSVGAAIREGCEHVSQLAEETANIQIGLIGEVQLLCVQSMWRGVGLSHILLAAAEEFARQQRWSCLMLYSMPWLCQIYEKHGYAHACNASGEPHTLLAKACLGAIDADSKGTGSDARKLIDYSMAVLMIKEF